MEYVEYNVIVLVLFLRDARDFKRIFFTTFSQVLHRNVRRVRSQNRAEQTLLTTDVSSYQQIPQR